MGGTTDDTAPVDGDDTATVDTGESVPDDSGLPMICNAGTRWEAGEPVYREVTADWGLEGVVGVRLSVTDIDSDGWADLIVRKGGGPDSFVDGGSRSRFLLRNTGLGTFADVTQSSGLLVGRVTTDPDVGRPGDNFASGDVDNDGDLDIFIGTGRTDPSAASAETCDLMINNGDGTFSPGPASSAARFVGDKVKPAGVSFVDVDRDGNLDLWVTNNEEPGLIPLPDKLLLGDGAGGFVDVTAARGLSTTPWSLVSELNEARSHSWAWSGAACDLNNDNIPELLASSYGRAPNHLWRGELNGEGDVVYVNESVASGYAFDPRQDWTQDLNAQCYCAANPSAAECDTCPAPADTGLCASLAASFGSSFRWEHTYGREPFRLGGNSGTTVCADINNDGFFDLLTHEIVHFDVGEPSDPSEILLNLGDPLVRLVRPGNDATGLNRIDASPYWDHGDMIGGVFDFDNDGWQDVYIGASDYSGNKGLLFHQTAPLDFELLDVSDYFEHFRADGTAYADFDRDGDLDLVVGHSSMRCSGAGAAECAETQQVRMFENLMGDGSNWVQLKLVGGPGSNAAAIGARVQVATEETTQMQAVDGGHGHYGMQRDLVLHYGLGPSCEADVTITWPDEAGSTQTFTVGANRRYVVEQGSAPLVTE